MDIEKIFKNLENKLPKEKDLSLKNKILLERIQNKDTGLIIELLIKKLEEIKPKINKLYSKQFNKTFTKNDKTNLEELQNQRKKILTTIKNCNNQKIKLKSSDFTGSDIIPSFGEILEELSMLND